MEFKYKDGFKAQVTKCLDSIQLEDTIVSHIPR